MDPFGEKPLKRKEKQEELNMADSNFSATAESLLKGIERLATTKTVVGDAVKIEDTIILPLVDVSCGMGVGAFSDNSKHSDKGAGAMNAKISPTAVLVIQNGITKLVSVKNQDAVTKVLDFVPDLVNRFTGNNKSAEISPEVLAAAEQIVNEQKQAKNDGDV